ncbi:cohesin domain-containing protein [Clostridium lundense]|uniref:cohesin domain-containing protein n=1 Tax=Clostridium lundense TaxID=319475 RepID=UPI0006863786|nr:cohesin domain-containing protein [Clostridium lundense]
MNRFYKKLSIVFVMTFAIILGEFTSVLAANDFEIGTNNLNNTIENSAKVGDKLDHPEKGWKRYSYDNNNISYIGDWMLQDGYFKYGISPNSKVCFNFKGNKIRILGSSYSDDRTTSRGHIKIDGNIIGNINENLGVYLNNMLVYENINLYPAEHFVEVYCDDYKQLRICAIDVDDNGEIKPYNEVPETQYTVLNIEPEKNKIHLNEIVTASLTIDNIKDIAAEDVRIKYDNTRLQFLDVDEVEGIKLVKQPDSQPGELRFIVASKGEKNIVNAKKALLKLKFKGITKGEALVDVTKGRVSDGIEMEKDLTDEQCGQATIFIDENAIKDVNNSGEFTLLDLAIDARHMGKDPKSAELAKYNTDIVPNKAIDDADLLEIGKLMLENPNYKF